LIRKLLVTATPVLTYTGGESAFDKVQVLQGEAVQANNKVITNLGGDFTYVGKIAYKDAMKMSELVVRIKAPRGKKSLCLLTDQNRRWCYSNIYSYREGWQDQLL
jgi:hypothetical protein